MLLFSRRPLLEIFPPYSLTVPPQTSSWSRVVWSFSGSNTSVPPSPHGHAHRAVAAAAVNDRQFTGANLARGRKAADLQAVSAQAVSVQIQREGLADIYAVRQHLVASSLTV